MFPSQYRYGTRRVWYTTGANVAGVVITGQWIIFALFLGFSFILMGATFAIVSASHLSEVSRIFGTVFLPLGGILLIIGLILLILAIHTANDAEQMNQSGGRTIPFQSLSGPGTEPVVSGTRTHTAPSQTGSQPPLVQSGISPYGQPSYPAYNNAPEKVSSTENRFEEFCPYPAMTYPTPSTGQFANIASSSNAPTSVLPPGYPISVANSGYAYTIAQAQPNTLPTPPPSYFQ